MALRDRQPDDKTRLTIDALAQNTPSLTPSDPMPLSYLRSKYADRRDYAGDEWSGFKQRQWMLGYSFEHEFDSGWGFNQKARYFDVDTHQRSAYSTGRAARSTSLTASPIPRMKICRASILITVSPEPSRWGLETSSAGGL